MSRVLICALAALAVGGCATPVAVSQEGASKSVRAERGTGTNIARRNRDAASEGIRGMSAEDVERLKRTGGSREQGIPQ
jgi:hypothetical protein